MTDVDLAPRPPSIRVEIPATGAAGPLDGVALVTLDRPKVLNALDFTLIGELTDALETLDGDPACRAIVITGAGDRAFAAGADIRELAIQTPATLLSEDHFHRWERIKRIRKPLIAAVEGLERRMIREALGKADETQTRAAELLGISERVLRYKLKKYGLS